MSMLERARSVMPGGVNSPVRAFGAVGGNPPFIASAIGSKVTDESGNEYIDYIGSWGPALLGHAHPEIVSAVKQAAEKGLSFGAATKAEVEIAELIISLVPNIEMVRLCSSGTEAAMSAVKLARGFSGKDKIIKFEGCYHGHFESMLVSAGSGAMTYGISGSAGVTDGAAKDTISVPYNSVELLQEAFSRNKGEIAAVIIEPLAANMGLVKPKDGYLQAISQLAKENGSLLIFDEVITGFRLGLGGAQDFYNIDADIVVMGKIIGGGMPVGCYGARAEIMQFVSPLGPVYQAGTLSGNPVAVAAGYAQLSHLKSRPSIYADISQKAGRLFGELSDLAEGHGASVVWEGSLGCLFFSDDLPYDYESAKLCDTQRFASWHAHMLASGIYLPPSQFEAIFVSAAHSDEDISTTISKAKEFFS